MTRFELIVSQVNEICALLGLDPNHVRRLSIEPRTVEATTYALNDEGDHYLDEHGEPSLNIRIYTIHPT